MQARSSSYEVPEMDSAAKAFVSSMARMKWQEFPNHFGGALSKELVSKSLVGTAKLDVRISHYQPMAYVQNHVHTVQEQVYYVLEGQGLLVVDGVEHLVGPHDYVWVPVGVYHAITACGISPLVFLVISGPAEDGAV
jgi:mannose-6-phosphate isomerase-like protein (cupin superfamily)